MSKEHLQSLLQQLEQDVDLQEKLKNAADLDDAVAIAKGLGFEVSKMDWLEHKRLIGPHWLWEWNWI